MSNHGSYQGMRENCCLLSGLSFRSRQALGNGTNQPDFIEFKREVHGCLLSAAKGAHKSKALFIAVAIRKVSSRGFGLGGQPKKAIPPHRGEGGRGQKRGFRLRYFEKSEGFNGLEVHASRVTESTTPRTALRSAISLHWLF